MPRTCETPLAGGASQGPIQQHTDNAIISDSPEDSKHAATLIANFALAGYAVHHADDGYLVCRWNYSKHCPDLRALSCFAKQTGVQQ